MTREEAIGTIENAKHFTYGDKKFEEAFDMAIESLTERKSKWIDHSEEGYVECPICGHLTTCEGNIEDLHYCFWCGTRMEVEEW